MAKHNKRKSFSYMKSNGLMIELDDGVNTSHRKSNKNRSESWSFSLSDQESSDGEMNYQARRSQQGK